MPLSQINIISDQMNGASEVEQYNRQGVTSYLKFDRVFLVDGLNQFSTPRTAMSDAKALIRSLYPVASLCPTNPIATARGYASMPTGSDDVVQVTLSYMYTDIAVSATQWTIEVANFLETVDTDTEYDVPDDGNATIINGQVIQQGNRRPIQVKYIDSWNYDSPKPVPTYVNSLDVSTGNASSYAINIPKLSYAHVGVFRPRKRIIITRTVYGNTQAQIIEAAADTYEGNLNLTIFRGRAPGYWMCVDCGIIYNPYEGSNLARLEFVGRPLNEFGWNPWVRYSSPLFHGTPSNVFRFNSDGSPGNGIRRSYQYLAADMNNLLALLPGGVQGDPSNNGS